ncbi:hypothetical protein [Archangium sp.]|uniref:hypothetical protein n=1 Tax=Archangium sp. TaxID=1872627 RepID=UPI00286BBD90|nr:hypothetical protein [Archangium sp.]
MKDSGRWLCLALLLLTSRIALAERLAVSKLEGDKKDRLRAQVTAVLRKTRKVQVLPPPAYAMAAGKLKLRGPAAVSPEAVIRVSTKLKLDAVLTGTASASTFEARLFSWDGQEVWSAEYPLKRGLLPPKEAQKLARAVIAVVNQPPRPASKPEPEPPAASEPVAQAEPEPARPSPETVEPAGTPEPAAPVVATAPTPEAPPAPSAPRPEADRPAQTKLEPVAEWAALDEESHTYTTELAGSAGGFPQARDTPEGQGEAEQGAAVEGQFPARGRVLLGAVVTWRKYCARPGVASCAEYDAQLPENQTGDTANFDPRVPYVGIAADAELFPLAHRPSLLRGVGLTLNYQRSFVRTTVQITTPSGSTPEREVYATDTAYGGMLAYRYFRDLGRTGTPMWGYLGLRLGALGRAFEVDEAVQSPLPVVHRFYPAVGLDLSVPLMRAVRIEGMGQFFFTPTPGVALGGDSTGSYVAEVRDYGQSVSSLGWAAELGLAGDIWGPVGYSARFRLERYVDGFSGQGTRRGWLTGGIAEDTFSSIVVGATASW